MENLGPKRRLREIFVSLVITSLMPILVVVEHNKNEISDQVSSTVVKTTSCFCDIVSERYIDTFFIEAKPNLVWDVSFKQTDPVVESITEVIGGYKVAVSSSYKRPFKISIVSSTLETLILEGGNCGAKVPQVLGPSSLCLSSTGLYSLKSSDVYTFSLSGGGVLNNLEQNSIEVLWGATAGTYNIIAVNTTNPCMPDVIYEVTIGEAYQGSLACNNQINLSLDGNCEHKVKLSDVFFGQHIERTALALVLKLEDGTIIPNNILTGAHVGKKIIASVTDGCGNNSCWGIIVFEDKSAPKMACTDTLTMECFKLQEDAVIVTANDCSPYEIRKVGSDQKTDLTCDPDFISRVIRKYQAFDIFGNLSDTCSVVLQVKRFPIDSVKFPYDLIDDKSLDCSALLNGTYLPETTGFPTIHDVILNKRDYPECNIIVSFTDQIIRLSNKTKIIRTWEILEWYCNSSNVVKHTQLIEIADALAPNIAKCIENLTISTDAHQCFGSVKLPLLSSQYISDNCSKTFEHQIVINNQENKKPGDLISLPLGNHQAIYEVTDEAGNTSTCNFTISVSDKTAPVAVCKEFVVMSLSHGGGYLTTNMIDNGSKDECSSVSLHIRRMDDPIDRPYRDTINVSCSDVEKPFKVMLRATDEAGNVNTCWTTVTVQDKSIPTLRVPDDITISCLEWMSDRDLNSYGKAEAYDQCEFTLEETVKENLNNCKVGTVVRTFTAKDATNTVTNSQTITVINNTLSDLSTIKAPRDTVLSGMCTTQSLHPDSLAKFGVEYGKPILPYGVCFNLGIVYKDELFTVQGPTNTNCFKVIRTWRIINWCENPSSVLELKQTIAVENKIAPSITLLSTDTLFHSQSCESGEFTLSATGADDCTPDNSLFWIWKILDNQKQIVLSGESMGKEVLVNRLVPIGEYTMLWSLRDGCGNIKEASQPFRIMYGKGASFFVVDTVALALSPSDSTNSACISARTLVKSASHACNVAVKYSFSPIDPNQDTICFDCKDLGNAPVTVYAHDAFGVVTSARTVVRVQDNNKINNCSKTTDCIIWPKDTTIDACTPSISPIDINSLPIVDPNCDCNTFTLSHRDRIISGGVSECLVIERVHFVTFRCFGIVTTFNNVQIINRKNAVNPVLSCPLPQIRASSTDNCNASLSVTGPDVVDAQCHTGLIFTHKINDGIEQLGNIANASFEVGTSIVTFIVTDACGNRSSCNVDVIVSDGDAPICNVQDVTVYLNELGNATIPNASIFDNGSRGACGPSSLTFAVNRSQFSCEDLGRPVQVEITLTASNGRTTTCQAIVSVQDTIRPQLIVRNITREITQIDQVITISNLDLIVSASDNCSVQDTIIINNTFTCQNVGQNIVPVTVRDSRGNAITANAIVTILDKVPPSCNTKDITISVNEQGIATITDASIFSAGTIGGCSGANLNYSVNKISYNCEDIGKAIPVLVTVSDNLGNTMICDAKVFVIDTIAPITTPKNLTLEITNENSTVTISSASLVSSVIENCSLVDTIISKSTFTCEDLGDNRVTIQVVDASGNRDTVEATVTVLDRQAPICNVRNISILLNAEGQALIGDASVFNSGSFDECNSIPLSFSVNKTMFTCEDLGPNNPVIITTTDAAGNSSTCNANVTVSDTMRPKLEVRDIQRTLTDINTPIVVNAAELIVSASDNCTLVDSANAPSVFTCANLGDNMVRVAVRDASGNVGNAEAIVTILDGIAPECRLKTATVMVNGGTTTIDSSFVDDGSFDACGEIVLFKVSPNTFSCEDIGEKLVTATLTDGAGNITTCQTTVTVVDGNQLVCVPKDITVTLGDDNTVSITADDVDGGSGTGCGNPVQKSINRTTFTCKDVGAPQAVLLTVMRPGSLEMSVCTALVTVVTPAVPRFICTVEEISVSCSEYNGVDIPNSVPRPTIAGSCDGNFKLDSTIIRLPRPCNLDTLTRTYLLFDLEDNLLGTCVQSVYIVNDQPLTIDSFDLPPQNVTLASCADKSTGQTGGVMSLKNTTNQGCADLEITFRDTFFTNTCNDTLRRIWTASDKCGSFSPIVYTQKIAINDTFAPVFSGVRDTIVFNQGDCGVQMTFENIQVTDCDSRLALSNNSPFARNSNSINPEGFYPIGVHTISLSATDVCGNNSNTSFTIEVRDTSTRNIVCRDVEKTIDPTGITFVSARELIGFYGDNCDESFNPRIVMSRPGQDTVQNKTYSCDDLILIGQELIKRDTMIVQVYNGNDLIHNCSAVLTIKGGENCQNFFFIKNTIKTTTNEFVPDFAISLMEQNKELVKVKTDKNGTAIVSVPMGADMMIIPTKNDDYLNGVNTLDLVQIQRHILGINKFRSPYQMIAADVNNDKKITVADIVEIRNLILGIKEGFEHHSSWIAIDANYEFPEGSNGLDEDYPQFYEISQLNSGMELDFIGVKIGDVDVSYTSNLHQNNLQQRSKSHEIVITDRQINEGELFTLDFEIDKLNAIGADINLKIDKAAFVGIDGQDWVYNANQNNVRIINYSGKALGNFSITFKALEGGALSDRVGIELGELYSSYLDRENLILNWQKVENEKLLESLKVYPNPMFAQTTVELISEIKEETTLIIADQLGKIISYKKVSIEEGLNKIILKRDNFNSNGVYHLILKSNNNQFASKIFVTE